METGSPSVDWLASILQDLDEFESGHTPSDPHSSGHTQPVPQLVGLSAPAAATVAGMLDAHTERDWAQINPDPSQIHTAAAAVEDIPPVAVVNAGLTHPQPDPYSTGHTSCCASTTAAGLPQSGGGGCDLAEVAVRGSCKRKKLVGGSSSQTSTPPEFNMVELDAGLFQSKPFSTDIQPPPAGSTDLEIVDFLKMGEFFRPHEEEVNLSMGEQDQMVPMDARSYVTTVQMMLDQKTHHGYWKEKDVKIVCSELDNIFQGFHKGIKRTFQFHMYDGTKTNWFMHEYVPTDLWGNDLFMKGLRFREVYYEGAEVPGEPTSPEVKIKNKPAAAKKHRMRGPDNLVIKGESPAWEHFIKIYDRHPEQEGSKLVYAVCRHCDVVLKAGTDNGTKSLLTHCNLTCPIKNNKSQQPSSLRAHLFRAVPHQE